MAEKKEAPAKKVLGGKKKSKRHVKEMHIRHAKSGGYIARHDLEKGQAGEPPEQEEHILPDLAALSNHVTENMQPQPQQEPAPPMAA